MSIQKYVLGFALDYDLRKVILIRKEKPLWQKGKLNGVGGKIEEGESSLDAMIREFEEESGLYIKGWNNFLTYSGNNFLIDIFYVCLKDEDFYSVKTITEELIEIHPINSIQNFPYGSFIPNILWMTKMAVSMELGECDRHFDLSVNELDAALLIK